MCEPTTMLLVASTVMSGVGQIQAAQSAAAANKYNARVAEMNADLAERRARDALERGAKEEQRKRREVAQVMGIQQAAMAANGVDLTFGSPLDTLIDTAVMGELDALTIRSNSYREAYDYRVDAATQRGNAGMNRAAAKSALTEGYLSAAGTVLGGGSKAYGTYKTNTVRVKG